MWRYTWSRDRSVWDKPPLTRSGHRASSTDSSTWCRFDEALEVYRAGDFSGVGYVFIMDDEFVGIDLDNCRDAESGKLLPWTADQRTTLPAGFPDPLEIVCAAASYFEVSPSGTGVKGIVCASAAKGIRTGPVEIYPNSRYFTLTGHRLEEAISEICEAQQFVDSLIARIELKRAVKPTKPAAAKPTTAVQPVSDDTALLERAFAARNGAKVRDLFEGRWQSHFPASAGPSEADLALCSELAFWTGPHAARIDGLFRQSSLYREKWDEPHDGDGRTYGEMTIAVALSSKADFHNWSQATSPKHTPATVAVGPLQLQPDRPTETASGKMTVGVDVLNNGEVLDYFTVSSSASGRKEACKLLLRLLPEGQKDAAVAEKALDDVLVLGRKLLLESPTAVSGGTVLAMLQSEAVRRWEFTHRDQQGLWSEVLGRSVNRNTLLELAICTEILDRAAKCADAPLDRRGEVQRDKLPNVVEKNARILFADLLSNLPNLEQAVWTDNAQSRVRDRLKSQIVEAWTKPQSMGIVKRAAGKDQVQLMERTSLAERIRQEAFRPTDTGVQLLGPQKWAQAQNAFSGWWRVHLDVPKNTLWLAMRYELFAATHVNVAEFGIFDQKSLTAVARRLGLLATEPPVPETIGHGNTRVIVLAPEVTAEIVYDTDFERPSASAEQGALAD
jgi:hypothetical protein